MNDSESNRNGRLEETQSIRAGFLAWGPEQGKQGKQGIGGIGSIDGYCQSTPLGCGKEHQVQHTFAISLASFPVDSNITLKARCQADKFRLGPHVKSMRIGDLHCILKCIALHGFSRVAAGATWGFGIRKRSRIVESGHGAVFANVRPLSRCDPKGPRPHLDLWPFEGP